MASQILFPNEPMTKHNNSNPPHRSPPFQAGEPGFQERTRELLTPVNAMRTKSASRVHRSTPEAGSAARGRNDKAGDVEISDPFGAASDEKLAMLEGALDPSQIENHLKRCVLETTGTERPTRLTAIRVKRWKPARRCLIEYDLESTRASGQVQAFTLVGKIRAKGVDAATSEILQRLRSAGFSDDSSDGISVPQPFGTIPALHMSLQAKVPGVQATDFLGGSQSGWLMKKIAQAACKVHRTEIHTNRLHTVADELRILHERLEWVQEVRPRWKQRLSAVLTLCDHLGASFRNAIPVNIHRDFYPDQILMDGRRLWLLDFDLFCKGDPALDIGNFLGHVTEQSLRLTGDPFALAKDEAVLQEEFISLSGESRRPEVHGYALLTLARHIWLSMQFPDRRPFTLPLLELCEERLSAWKKFGYEQNFD